MDIINIVTVNNKIRLEMEYDSKYFHTIPNMSHKSIADINKAFNIDLISEIQHIGDLDNVNSLCIEYWYNKDEKKYICTGVSES